ncbi:hypothetical protein N7474_008787 [Penicillium riverlandense]|uniref:uncharacterized protein n=1 Tax=Penicillium riverlandense TaxID=1903569 RepID=UPI002548F776|nr:uncharacterized protein N7474_008787 [Penicillium riverlandense]KAJ5812486.1 hypothetical protein N7474_008787 [Penicillium riverlandense]
MSLDDELITEPNAKRAKSGQYVENGIKRSTRTPTERVIEALFSESVMAKLWNVASKALRSSKPPVLYPEYTGKDGTTYVYRSLDFWTSGFFPGSLYLIHERQIKYPQAINHQYCPHPLQMAHLCRLWTANLHQNALKRDTHDLGFMIAPWAMQAWNIYHDPTAYNTLVMAAHSLASRFNATTKCLRSWDVCITNRYSFTDPSQDFLVIIDNMLNLDLLFWAAHETSNKSLYEIALAHACTTQKHHIREDNTTFHVVNFDAETGDVKAKFTNQGYGDDSCWARGQAWGILGFMQTFEWTADSSFLNTAKDLADYFIANLPADGVPYWDFSVPVTAASPRDTSAAMIAACGMLLIYKALRNTPEADHYLSEAISIVDATVTKFLNPPTFRFKSTQHPSQVAVFQDGDIDDNDGDGFDILSIVDVSDSKPRDTILDGATINNFEFAPRRWSNHGLVYADYYFLRFGNMLLELGLVDAPEFSIHHRI